MKYTSIFLKYALIVLLVLVTMIGCVFGLILGVIGLFGALLNSDVGFLAFIPIAFVCALVGMLALDAVTRLMDKWGLTK